MRQDRLVVQDPPHTKTCQGTAQTAFRFQPKRKRRRREVTGPESALPPGVEPGKVPRISRLMALAIKFQGLIRDGIVADYADLARLGFVSRSRMTQIMSLLSLAPDIQEEILDVPADSSVSEHAVRPICGILDWEEQRVLWRRLYHPTSTP
jgi:hypothetical protein